MTGITLGSAEAKVNPRLSCEFRCSLDTRSTPPWAPEVHADASWNTRGPGGAPRPHAARRDPMLESWGLTRLSASMRSHLPWR